MDISRSRPVEINCVSVIVYEKYLKLVFFQVIEGMILPGPTEGDENVKRLTEPGHIPKHLPITHLPNGRPKHHQKECRVCKKRLSKFKAKNPGSDISTRVESVYYCPKCPSQPGLCFKPKSEEPDCFERYHTVVKYWK